MPDYLQPFLSQLGQTGLNYLTSKLNLGGNTQTSYQSPFNMNTILGSLLTGASALGRDEPGYLEEARQYLRNQLSPQGIPSQFTGIVSGLSSQFEPFLRQQEQQLLNNVQQRIIAGQPASFSTAMSGNEIGAIRSAISNELIPRRQAFYGDLAMRALGQQGQSARNLLELSRPDPLREGIATLAAALLSKGMLGGGGGAGIPSGTGTGDRGPFGTIIDQWGGGGGGAGPFDQTNPLGQLLNNIFGGGGGGQPPSGGAGTLFDQVSGAFGGAGAGAGAASSAGQFLPAVSDLFAGQAASFGSLQNGVMPVLSNAGDVIGYFNPATGSVATAQGATLGNVAVGGGTQAGLFSPLSSLSGILSGLGTAAGGYVSGNLIGQQLPGTELGGTFAGAAGGAAAGALAGTLIFPVIGTALGAIIGGVAGAFGGFKGSQSAADQEEAARLAADMQSQNTTTSNIGAFWTDTLRAAGYQDILGFANFVGGEIQNVSGGARTVSYGGFGGTYDQPDSIAAIGSKLLLQQIQKTTPSITSLDQVPSFRDSYISYILNKTFIEQEGSVVPTQDISQKGSLLSLAGL